MQRINLFPNPDFQPGGQKPDFAGMATYNMPGDAATYARPQLELASTYNSNERGGRFSADPRCRSTEPRRTGGPSC